MGTPLDDEDALIVDVAGYEGPLDLLLALARTQKVDIAKISVLALADQYLLFIAEAQKLRLELAADYLVMAAWLAFLKSRLLLPREAGEATDVSAEELARRLSFRLMRLEAMRDAAAELMTRMRLGRDVFQRGMPEGTKTIRETAHTRRPSTICCTPTPISAAAPSRSGTWSRRAPSGRSRMRARAWSVSWAMSPPPPTGSQFDAT